MYKCTTIHRWDLRRNSTVYHTVTFGISCQISCSFALVHDIPRQTFKHSCDGNHDLWSQHLGAFLNHVSGVRGNPVCVRWSDAHEKGKCVECYREEASSLTRYIQYWPMQRGSHNFSNSSSSNYDRINFISVVKPSLDWIMPVLGGGIWLSSTHISEPIYCYG